MDRRSGVMLDGVLISPICALMSQNRGEKDTKKKRKERKKERQASGCLRGRVNHGVE